MEQLSIFLTHTLNNYHTDKNQNEIIKFVIKDVVIRFDIKTVVCGS